MAELIKSATTKLEGVWINIRSDYINEYFEYEKMPVYKVFKYPGGNFVTFVDNGDLLTIKLKWTMKELEREILDWAFYRTIQRKKKQNEFQINCGQLP